MRRFLGKIVLFLLLLLMGQVMVAYFYPSEVPAPIVHFQTLLDEGVEILYLGDSTLWHPADSQTTAEMLQERLPTHSIGELSHAAYGMDVYDSYVANLLRQDLPQAQRPKLIIIPINMRSFSPEWDLRPGYQFTREKRILEMGIPLATIVGRPLQLFGGYQTGLTQDEFLHSVVYSGATPVGQVQDFEGSVGGSSLEDQGAEQFVYYQELSESADYPRLLTYYYLNELSSDHRKVRAMLDIVRHLQAAQVDVLFYITPINVELGDVHLGEFFRRQFTANVAVVKEQLATAGITEERGEGGALLDLSFDLAAYFFSDTEHLRQPGKQYIAEQLAAYIDPTAMTPTATPQSTTGTPLVAATPTPPATIPANPLLATAMARATQAAGTTNGTVDGTPVAPAATPTPITNPLLATAVMRATAAAEQK